MAQTGDFGLVRQNFVSFPIYYSIWLNYENKVSKKLKRQNSGCGDKL